MRNIPNVFAFRNDGTEGGRETEDFRGWLVDPSQANGILT